MSIVVNTNVSSIIVQRSLNNATNNIQDSVHKLSTGFRINKAADDAAGLTISESLKSQGRGAAVASDNAQTGINLLQTAEGDLAIIQENLQRIRDLTVQAANGTNGSAERTAIQAEVQQRVSEIDRLAKNSSFNEINLLDGSATALHLQIGANATASLNAIDIVNDIATTNPLERATASALGLNVTMTNGKAKVASEFYETDKITSFLNSVDNALSEVSARRSTIGSFQNRLESAIDSLNIQFENMSASESRIRDVDVADEAANLTKQQILQQASSSLLAQANQAPSIALSLV